MLTEAYCSAGGEECVSEHGKNMCDKLSGHCVVKRDGYYIMTAACVTLSSILLVWFILPTIKRLQCEFGICSLYTDVKLTASSAHLGLAGKAVRQRGEDMSK
jgi:hypothetical protein